MAEPTEFVDINHTYITDHDERDFEWGFDGDKAMKWAAQVVAQIVGHAVHGGPEHAFELLAVQAGILLADLPKDTQLPVLMMAHGDENDSGYVPIAVMLVPDDKIIPLAHTMGNLIDDEGVHPALPSRMEEAFNNPPVEVDDSIDPITGMPWKVKPTTVMDLLAAQWEKKGTTDEDA